MKLNLPSPRLIETTSDVDYWYWNYKFPLKYIQRYRFKIILEIMGEDLYENLLEIGTGSGIFLPELSKHCHNLYAIDVHDKMDSVKRLCDANGVKAVIETKSIEDTGYPSEMFDAVVGVSVWEFFQDLEKASIEILRIMKTTGKLFTICPHRNAVLDSIVSLYSIKHPGKVLLNPYGAVRKALEKHFKVTKKCFFPRLIGRILPIYHYYKLDKL